VALDAAGYDAVAARAGHRLEVDGAVVSTPPPTR